MCSPALTRLAPWLVGILIGLPLPVGFAQSPSTRAATDSGDDLVQLSLSASGDHRPVTDDRFTPVQQELFKSATRLESALGGDNKFAQAWKQYLKWDLLAPQLDPDAAINRTILQNLDTVLRRFRANRAGLELPVFRRTAAALERYREFAFWHALAERRETGPLYEAYVKELSKQLERHQVDPTVETTRQIGKALGTLDLLGDSPQVVSAIRGRFAQPNVWADISTDALNELAAPICQLGPVRDCILGASVRGTALTSGRVHFEPGESSAGIDLNIRVRGVIHSRTNSYKKPVRIHSTGTTPYTASKKVLLADDRFMTAGHQVAARTRTRIHSVNKMGGRLGKRLIERIAWKKVYESKSQSEYIAARHAEQRIADNLNQRIRQALANGRTSYETKVRAPLIRVDLLGQGIDLTSSPSAIHTRVQLASYKQLSADTLPPGRLQSNDITVQVHETAVNNFLPVVLAGAKLSQPTADQPPRLEGTVPPWLKKLSQEAPEKLAGAKQPSLATEPVPESDKLPFRPWYFKFNSEHPASVSFRDQKFVLRLRMAELLASEDPDQPPIKNWDFIVTYRVSQRDGRVVLVREGNIDVLPTGFDPRWDTKLTGEQVGIRNNMAKNINKRAASGEGFPAEIVIPPIKVPKNKGGELTLQIAQIDCDQGWLTLGYQVP